MKKSTKGAIAATAAVALLLGTGGSLALWNDSVNVGTPTTITAGDLRLAQKTAPTWTIQHTSGADTAVADIAAVRLVPGDKLVYTGTYSVTAQGQNLVFKADVADGSIAAATPGKAEDVALAGRIAQTAAYNINGAAGQTATIKHKSNTAGTYDVQIAVTLDWPLGAAGSPAQDNPAKKGAVNLSQFAISATQVDGTSTP
ncbi:alternate-type signal peptide domain-containing protein [Galactobacter caseinivorans]|uniref:Alternate-type signal peptide domain-containing protein n=1 Tax=Galactobacter caseinivorans TaxID=2676123 RepID=A0A496PG51_9MICC|nr:alternate-type signal peptide domain-containing protein [Galactobacter caseinivorans]RKW69410.1 alternate-type signal peptide domain-containing protein [Galactobacter caseinivorans]